MSRKIIRLQARKEKDSRFVVAVPQIVTHWKRVRRIFTNLREANTYINDVADHGYEKAESIRCNDGKIEVSNGALKEWIQKYLAELKAKGRVVSWRYKRYSLGKLERMFGNRPINSIIRDDLLAWMQTIEGAPATRKNHQIHAHAFFDWCIEELDDPPVNRNPIRKNDRIEVEHTEPVLLKPEQLAACIQWAKDNNEREMLAYLCIGGFHGVRTEEIIRMNWEDLDWRMNKVHVLRAKRVRGFRSRHLEMKDGLRKHLQLFALESGPILSRPPRAENVSDSLHARLKRFRKSMLRVVGIASWPHNALRHSFKSYHEALHEDFLLTQREMGHTSQKMNRYGYGADQAGGFYIDKAMAERWFTV